MKRCLIATALAAVFFGSQVEAEHSASVYDYSLALMPIGKLVDTLSLEQLADIVVTEAKIDQSAHTITQKIQVLRAEELEQQTVVRRNLAELLRYTSGQFVNVLSRNDANWGSYAGLGPKYNTYLLDGVPIDSFVDAMSLDPWAFERIELHKGPAAVLYSNYLTMDFAGNQAPLAGTTNFVLKDRIEIPLTRWQIKFGSYQTWTGRVYHQNRAGAVSYLLGGYYERSAYTQYGERGSWLQVTDDPDYDKLKLYGKISLPFGEHQQVSLFAHRTAQRGDAGRPHRDFDHDYTTVNLAYHASLTETLQLSMKAGYREYDRRFDNDAYPPSFAWVGRDRTWQRILPVDVTLNFAHGQGGLLTLGVDGQWLSYRTVLTTAQGVARRDNEATAQSWGWFVQEKLQLGDWIVRAGVRHNHIAHDYRLLGGQRPSTTDAAWEKTLWNFGARYNFAPQWSVYANAGTSFMPPAAKQVGGTLPAAALDGAVLYPGQLPNPHLAPETGLGSDVGLDWQPSDRLTFGLRLFYNRLEDAIIDSVVNPSPSQTISLNAGRSTARGAELDIHWRLSEQLEGFANVTRTLTAVCHPRDADQDGTAIPFAPDWLANVGFTARLPGATLLTARYRWIGRYYDSVSRRGRQDFGHYGILDVRLQKSLYRDAERALHLTLDLNNLFDERFTMPWSFRDPGINVSAALNLVF